jgi:hypothetical protein
MHRKVAAALVAALALGIAACGSSEPLTRAQLARQIEIVCRQAQQQLQAQARAGARVRLSPGESQKQFVVAVVAGQRGIEKKLEDLDAPDQEKESFDAYKQAVKERADLYERVSSGSAASLSRAMLAVQDQGEALSSRIRQATRRLGVETCA